ncbi:hypothetical protein [Mucilaginibacter antarcticus]|uniref:hypothetical protein n=1 Tax=Mucilaginibacter antarcticus TaxID=1855725 RepID=UPI003631164E
MQQFLSAFFFPDLWTRWMTFLVGSIFIGITNLTINCLGYHRAASWSLAIMLWVYITIPCYTAGGMVAPGIISQMSVILTAGFLLGWRGGLICGLLTVGVDFVFAYMEVIGSLPQPVVLHTPITRWLGTAIPFGTILSLQYYATNHLRTSLVSLRQEISKREEAENIKDEALYSLQERVKELKTLYVVSDLLRKDDITSEKTFTGIAETLPSGWQYPEITAACISVAGKKYQTSNFRPAEHRLYTKDVTAKGIDLEIEIVYLKTMPVADEGPF